MSAMRLTAWDVLPHRAAARPWHAWPVLATSGLDGRTHRSLTVEIIRVIIETRERAAHGLDCEDQHWRVQHLKEARARLN